MLSKLLKAGASAAAVTVLSSGVLYAQEELYYTTSSSTVDDAALGAIGAGVFIVAGLIGLALYVYMAMAFMTIGNKVGEPNSWMAWVPLLNYYYYVKLAMLPGWTFLIFFAAIIPALGGLVVLGFFVYVMMKIAERRGFPNWIGILMIVPLVNLFVPGYLAWAEPTGAAKPAMPATGSQAPEAQMSAKEVSAVERNDSSEE